MLTLGTEFPQTNKKECIEKKRHKKEETKSLLSGYVF